MIQWFACHIVQEEMFSHSRLQQLAGLVQGKRVERRTSVPRARRRICLPRATPSSSPSEALLEAIIPERDRDTITIAAAPWADFGTYLTERYGVRTVLVNPASYPHESWRAY